MQTVARAFITRPRSSSNRRGVREIYWKRNTAWMNWN